jgi:Fe-S-cluster containining protein
MSKIEIKTIQDIEKEVQEIYKNIPKAKVDCHNLCKSGKCKFECCTVTGCAPVERLLINRFIEKNKLNFPLIEETQKGFGYILPNSLNADEEYLLRKKSISEMPKCLYLTPEGCGIYEARPYICRIFGLGKKESFLHCIHSEEGNFSNEDTFEGMGKLINILPKGSKLIDLTQQKS